MGESGKVILKVSIRDFSGAVETFFGQIWLSPLEKFGPYAYDNSLVVQHLRFCGVQCSARSVSQPRIEMHS